ncbi:MAG TPA: DNA replication and repair protein RecF [Saprospiraceae bacterium]|nr:DNA replication and repair protein RecF [Saprospiraceae bacterium]
MGFHLFLFFKSVLHLNSIQSVGFKNLSEINLALKPGVHFIIGDNGMGKTNFLDAIYYSAMAKSYFGLNDKDIIQHGKDFFRIQLEYQQQQQTHQLEIKYKSALTKEFSRDHIPYSKLSDHIGNIPLVMITPDDIFYFLQDHEERRKFLNQTLVQTDPIYLDHLQQYTKVLKQRNALLKFASSSTTVDLTLLDLYDEQLVRSGNYIYQCRQNLLQQIAPWLSQMSLFISGKQQDSSIEFESDAAINLQHCFEKNRSKDLITQRSNTGIHRDKLNIKMNGLSLNEFGSQGQIKTFLIALKLAQVQYLSNIKQTKALFLLDDLFSKLDQQRIHSLLSLLVEQGIEQCFITDTDPERAKKAAQNVKLNSYFYTMNHGICTTL